MNRFLLLCQAKQRQQQQKSKNLFIVKKSQEQKNVLEKLDTSLVRMKKLTRGVQSEILELKEENEALKRNSCRVHCDLETTLDDAKKTQKELEKIEKMFRSSMAARKYKPFTS